MPGALQAHDRSLPTKTLKFGVSEPICVNYGRIFDVYGAHSLISLPVSVSLIWLQDTGRDGSLSPPHEVV